MVGVVNLGEGESALNEWYQTGGNRDVDVYVTQPPSTKPVITSPLVITREITPSFCSTAVGGPCFSDIPTLPYFIGDTLTAQFTITNKGTAPITFDNLTVGGRLNGGCPTEGCPDFTHHSLTLQPGKSHNYEGSMTLTQSGNYHFFIAYYIENPTPEEKRLLDENNWNTSINLGEGLTDEDRTKDIEVKYIASLYPSTSATLEIANLNDGEMKQVYGVIRQVLDIDRARSKFLGDQEEASLDDVTLLLNQLDPKQRKAELHDIVKGYARQDIVVEAGTGVVGPILSLSMTLTIGPWISLLTLLTPIPSPAEAATWLGLEWGENMELGEIGTATVKDPEVGRMEVVWLRPPKDKILVNIYLKKSKRWGTIIISAGEWQRELRMKWGLNAQSTIPVWNENILTDPESIIEHVQIISLRSPGELRVYDSEGNVTGLVDGEIKPNFQSYNFHT